MASTITLYELSNYNAGKLIPHTFDLDSVDTQAEWREAVQDWLQDLTKQTGDLCEEWVVADFEDVPNALVGEWDIDPCLLALQGSRPSQPSGRGGVLRAGIELGIEPERVDELYQGTYDGDEDFAYQMADDLGLLPTDTQWPTSYID